MHLSQIYRYPLKSGAAEALEVAEVQSRGIAHDRRWMVVDGNGRFVSGRTHPQLVRISATIADDGGLILRSDEDATGIRVPVPESDAPRLQVTVWDAAVSAALADRQAADWLSLRLGMPVRLVYMDAAAQRAVDPKYASPGDEVSFADGFPLLLVSASALTQLNARASHAVELLRFRPNLVIEACPPHAEDRWRRIRIGTIEFELPKPCVRCVFTTIDSQLGRPDPAGEPLRTLKDYRRGPKGITFGMNVIARGTGLLRRGDALSVLEQLL